MQQYEGKPFVLLGVNSDGERDFVKTVAHRKGVVWRSWWDGSPPGPIAKRWNVRHWPTSFVIDPSGVIRFANVQGPNLEAAVDFLLKEMASKLPKS